MTLMDIKPIMRVCKKKPSLGRMFPSVPALQEMLHCCEENIRYNKLRMKCHIYEKVAFIKYLKFCTSRGLILNNKVYGKKGKSIYKPLQSWFIISEKGRLFLEMME